MENEETCTFYQAQEGQKIERLEELTKELLNWFVDKKLTAREIEQVTWTANDRARDWFYSNVIYKGEEHA